MATTLYFPSRPSKEELKGLIGAAFSHYKIKSPLYNPNALMVQNRASIVLVTYRTKGGKISGGAHTANLGVALGMGFGVFLGLIGSLIFLLIVYMVNQDTFDRMELEVAGVIEGLSAARAV